MKIHILILLFLNINCVNNDCKIPKKLSEKAVQELNTVLHNEQKFIKVHAAEFLLWLDLNRDDVKKTFLKEDELFENEPKYRIGIWRVLAQAASDETEKQKWIDKILKVFIDSAAPDRIHAAETLAKLKTSPQINYRDITTATLNDTNNILSVYTRWATSFTSTQQHKENKKKFIDFLFNSSDTVIRKISAYVLLKSKDLTDEEWKIIADRALAEPATSPLKSTLLNTAFVTFSGDDLKKSDSIKKEMIDGSEKFSEEQRIALSQSLADKGTCDDIKVLESFLSNENINGLYDAHSSLAADVRAFAAYAILNIEKRNQ